MKPIQPFLFLILLVTSCQSPQSPKAPQNNKKDTVKAPTQDTVKKRPPDTAEKRNAPIDTTFAHEDFPTFWQRFRTAALAFDTSQIMSMVDFPLETRGPLDDDPHIFINKENFVHFFKSYLKQYAGVDLQGSTELDGIRKTVAPDKNVVNDRQQARVGDLWFDKTPEGWKITFAYTTSE
jgi:hypothetical protein